MNKLFIFAFLVLSTNYAMAQTGCRRNSDGILFQNRIFLNPDYNANLPGPNLSTSCLPFGTTGTSCTIRVPGTFTSFSGTFGNYSVVNCNLDHFAYGAVLAAGLFAFSRMRKVQ
ncbi:MAG: hypothetical protein EOO45_07725 [Flavobacterium sp.]|nr:MAG: hypothetical protein EOO45_07725 [Flavobacterium sp.]